jgi:hypothetical protein
MIDIDSLFKSLATREDLREAVKVNKWQAIRSLYKASLPEILARKSGAYGIDPYLIDWVSVFSPIEMMAWQDIRGLGLPMYPQFPVGGVFVDFGDPLKQIAFECDGQKFHDKEEDRSRDTKLKELGWTVFRATGAECNRVEFDLPDLLYDRRVGDIEESEFTYKMARWAMNSSSGVLAAIAWKFYGYAYPFEMHQHLEQTLEMHSFFYRGEW